jgi:hypothetical protein
MSRACAQRLLQPLRRVALEEAVPACAPSCSYATEAASQAETAYKPISTMDVKDYKAALVLYNRERAKWRREVSLLRRQWLQECQEQRRQQQEQKEAHQRKRQEEMDRKAAEHRSTAQSAQLLHEIRQAELELQIVSALPPAGSCWLAAGAAMSCVHLQPAPAGQSSLCDALGASSARAAVLERPASLYHQRAWQRACMFCWQRQQHSNSHGKWHGFTCG